ncbi:MAG: hypothetical protein OK436_07605 [Thaumarchaeota archaeon]|nr:hypothetical protein [Nitrososphaerota archaeon]
MISAIRDWGEIRHRWSRDFENVLDALTMASGEVVSKSTKNQLELAAEIVKARQKGMLEVIQTLERMDRRLHGIDIAADGPKNEKEFRERR